MSGEYILACDEHGNDNWSSTRRVFSLGGIAVSKSEEVALVSRWETIKARLCGNPSVELKWSHFFPGNGQGISQSPLLEPDTSKWSGLAVDAVQELLENSSAFPICAVVHKDRCDQISLSRTSRRGNRVLDVGYMTAILLSQFALYLEDKGGTSGEIWFDNLGSQTEQNLLANNIQTLITRAAARGQGNQKMLSRINPTIQFFDSQQEALVQIADFVSGVISEAAEGDDQYLRQLLDFYAPGERRTYGIAVLQP